jgi:hypothetical protein
MKSSIWTACLPAVLEPADVDLEARLAARHHGNGLAPQRGEIAVQLIAPSRGNHLEFEQVAAPEIAQLRRDGLGFGLQNHVARVVARGRERLLETGLDPHRQVRKLGDVEFALHGEVEVERGARREAVGQAQRVAALQNQRVDEPVVREQGDDRETLQMIRVGTFHECIVSRERGSRPRIFRSSARSRAYCNPV